MTFPADLENWLDREAEQWRRPSRREFFDFFERWRRTFEPQFEAARPIASGPEALSALEARLPVDGLLFCEPSYERLPSATGHPFFVFEVKGLRRVHRDLFNEHDVTVADAQLHFCCICTHEAGMLADASFWAIELTAEVSEKLQADR